MRDEYGRINNRAQIIRSLDKLRLAHFLTLIVENPEEYPKNTMEWLDWLNAESGDNIDKL
ncbi:hypothetical protein C823_007870 [Eubacterium plexicaudatum ASF492]|uniref:Uncharacterized protein n=1 Tax=Eubacterium plexicaudatum ASF492 TaxID=1235802 RepID=N2A535_9FIRM|nr:hypothetical protein C823_007870 [Eubacterium plexicaudatum ASF492]